MIVISTPFNSNLMPMFAAAKRIADSPDFDAVHKLCDRLTGLKGYKTMDLARQVAGVKVPRGYLHVRVFDKEGMHEIASCFSSKVEPARVSTLVIGVSMTNRSLAGQWVKTEPLFEHPYAAPGVLDLVATFEPRTRKLRCYDLA